MSLRQRSNRRSVMRRTEIQRTGESSPSRRIYRRITPPFVTKQCVSAMHCTLPTTYTYSLASEKAVGFLIRLDSRNKTHKLVFSCPGITNFGRGYLIQSLKLSRTTQRQCRVSLFRARHNAKGEFQASYAQNHAISTLLEAITAPFH